MIWLKSLALAYGIAVLATAAIMVISDERKARKESGSDRA
jgi:hypothetical protein